MHDDDDDDHDDDASVIDEQTGLPNRDAFLAVLEAEEQRSRRHGGTHGLVLVQLAGAAQEGQAERAALAIAGALREIDFLARIDHRTFGVLALHCDNLDTVVRRLRASLEGAGVPLADLIAHASGADLRGALSAMTLGAPPVGPAARYIDFVPSPRVCLN